MNFTQAIRILNKRLTKNNPNTFTSLWIQINAPRAFRFIKKEIKTELGDTDWDRITRALDPLLQRRWMGERGKRRKKKVKKYKNKNEVEIVLKKYQSKLYTFLTPLDKTSHRIRDTISITLVRIAQKGNVVAQQEIIKLVGYLIEHWLDTSPRLARWRGYTEELEKQIIYCIRRFRYAGTFIGYVFRTLEYAGQGLQPLYLESLDEEITDTGKRKIDRIFKDPVTGEIRYFKKSTDHFD
jgi:hypothetical protein